MEDVKQGDTVRTLKYAQPLEVIKVYPAIRQAECKPAKGPSEHHGYEQLKPYIKE